MRQDGRLGLPVRVRTLPHRFPEPTLHFISTMATKTQRPQGHNGVPSTLNVAIDALNLAKETTSVTPVKTAFTSAGVLLTMIRVGFLPIYAGRLLTTNVYRTRWSRKWTISN